MRFISALLTTGIALMAFGFGTISVTTEDRVKVIAAIMIFLGLGITIGSLYVIKGSDKSDKNEQTRHQANQDNLKRAADALETLVQMRKTEMGVDMDKRQDVDVNKVSVDKKEFEALLNKAARPVPEWNNETEGKQTKEPHPSDGCTDKHKYQDKTEGEED